MTDLNVREIEDQTAEDEAFKVIEMQNRLRKAKHLELVKYRDHGMPTYTFFWTDRDTSAILSPYFDREEEAMSWAVKNNYDPWDEWKANKDIPSING
jgi:hypothetical protein